MCFPLFPLSQDITKALQLNVPRIAMRPTTYVATTSFGNLYLSLRVCMTSRILAIKLIGFMIVRIWSLFLALSTISPTMVMTISHFVSSGFVRFFVPEVCQRFGLRDGFTDSPDLSAFQLRPSPTLQPIHEMEQHIFICEVGNLKCEWG